MSKPPCYYKFFPVNLYAIKSVLNGNVKFTPIKELNDPAELVLRSNQHAVTESLHILRRDGYSAEDMTSLQQQQELLRVLVPELIQRLAPQTSQEASEIIQSPVYDFVPGRAKFIEQITNTIACRVGLFCLSKNYESLPMWAHYADNARGLVFEFKELEKEFPGDETNVLRQPMEVTYRDDSIGMTFDPASHHSLFFTKIEDWGYEKEVRVVLPLSECTQHENLYLYSISKECIGRLILGWNMSDENTSAIRRIVEEVNPNVEVCKARLIRENGNRFKVKAARLV